MRQSVSSLTGEMAGAHLQLGDLLLHLLLHGLPQGLTGLWLATLAVQLSLLQRTPAADGLVVRLTAFISRTAHSL